MAFTGAKADRESVTIPPELRPNPNATLMVKFRAGAADADGDGYLNPQELRNLASRLAKMETEDELRAALSGVLSGRLLEGFFKYREEALQKAAKEARKARDDIYYMALLQAQIAEMDFQISQLEDGLDYLRRTGDVKGTMAKPGIQTAIDAWKQHTGRAFDPDDPKAVAILTSIIEDDLKDKRQKKSEAEQKLTDSHAVGLEK